MTDQKPVRDDDRLPADARRDAAEPDHEAIHAKASREGVAAVARALAAPAQE
jgi:hypothetical protein